ncbi:MAG: CPP1-like family protein [Cyanobacteria bacterium J06626_6]
MSEQSVHYETLGLTESSSFEEVQSARSRLAAEYEDDPQRKEGVEAAYDAILMERLRLRQEGKIKVPDRIRLGDQQQAKPKRLSPLKGSLAESSGPQWLSDLLDQPENGGEILWPSVIFAGFVALSWLLKSEDALGASMALALGMMASIYFLNKKTRRLWRSLGLATIGLVVGLCLGLVIVQILGSQGTSLPPSQVSSLSASVTLAVLWFVTGFLR